MGTGTRLGATAALLTIAGGLLHVPTPRRARPAFSLSRLPVTFEANAGQAAAGVRFLARAPGSVLLLSSSETVLELPGATVRTRLEGASEAIVEGLDELPGRSNYLIGRDRAKWRTGIPHFRRVRYREVYPGIDLVFHGSGRQLEYDFIVAPGADAATIRMRFEGVTRTSITREGDLALAVGRGEVRQHKPRVYQDTPRGRVQIAGGYRLLGGSVAGFEVAAYDRSLPLVIDPVLSYASYFGAAGDELGFDIAIDGSGSLYLTGGTTSPNFPLASPLNGTYRGGDAFVTKLTPAGDRLVYSTFLGGSAGDIGRGIAVDASGNVYITGDTLSTDFPQHDEPQFSMGGDRDAFVTKLNAAGNAILFSTYLGGSAAEIAFAIDVDASENMYVTGYTDSTNFPTAGTPIQAASGGGRDVFVTKYNSFGTYSYSTYLGSTGGELGNSIAVDAAGNAYVGGVTGSNAWRVVNPIQRTRAGGVDGFVSKLNATGRALVYSTYLGGTEDDAVNAVALAKDGGLVVTGTTRSTSFPTMNAARPTHAGGDDGFVTKLNAAGSALDFSTYLGGAGGDSALGVAVDPGGNIYVAGTTDSEDFPALQAIQARAGRDAFVTRLTAAGVILYSTWFGGSATEAAYALVADFLGNVWVAGGTDSTDMRTVSAIQPRLGHEPRANLRDVFLIRLDSGDPLPAGPLSLVDAASFQGQALAPESIVAAYGRGLASAVVVAESANLPETLAGVGVRVRDSRGTERTAGLFFVSGGQINFVMPAGTSSGRATVSVMAGDRVVASGNAEVRDVSPAIFTAAASGAGVAAALELRVANGQQTTTPIFTCTGPGACTPRTIDLTPGTGDVYLLLFGTGIRGARAVRVDIDSRPVEVLGAAAQGQYAGLDQVNLKLSADLAGRGDTSLSLVADGLTANVVGVRLGGPPPPPVPRITGLVPALGLPGQTIRDFRINGENLAGVTRIEFAPSAGITVSNIRPGATTVLADVAIAADAATGNRSVTVAAPAGTSNSATFDVRASTPPPTGLPLPTAGTYLPVNSGMEWTYRVTFPQTVQLPYAPIVESPAGLLCSNLFCGLGTFNAGQIEFRVTVGQQVSTEAWSATVTDQGPRFYFAGAGPIQMRRRTVSGNQQLELMQAVDTLRLVRPLARPSDADLFSAVIGTRSVTVPAGTFNNVLRTEVSVSGGPGTGFTGTYRTEVELAPYTGIVKAVMRDPSNRELFTQELVRYTPPTSVPAPEFRISNLRAGPAFNEGTSGVLPIEVDFADTAGLSLTGLRLLFNVEGVIAGFMSPTVEGAAAGQRSGTMRFQMRLTNQTWRNPGQTLGLTIGFVNSRGVETNPLSGTFTVR